MFFPFQVYTVYGITTEPNYGQSSILFAASNAILEFTLQIVIGSKCFNSEEKRCKELNTFPTYHALVRDDLQTCSVWDSDTP